MTNKIRLVTLFLFPLFSLFFFESGKYYIIQLTTVLVASITTLFFINTIVLYVYLKYLVSPNQHKGDMFKPLRLTHKSVWPRLEKLRQTENKPGQPTVVDIPEIDAAFDHLMKLVVRDFIQSWFQKIAAQEQSFPISVDRVIRSAVVQVTQRLQQTDLLHVLLNRIVPKLASHISDFRSAEIALRGKYLERSVTQSDELDLLLASQFRQGKLHAALTTGAVTTKPTEIAYLRQLLDRVLPLMIEKNEIQSGPVHVVIREILSCSVLQPIMDMLADPDFWNQTIDTYVGLQIINFYSLIYSSFSF